VAQLRLWLPAGASVQEPVLPPGYSLRGLCAGDEAGWCALLDAARELGPWDLQRLRRQIDGGLVASTQRFVVAGGELVACAGVYDRRCCGLPAWEIGWVAVHPAHRRRGLGRSVTAAAALACGELAPRPVFLLTDDQRVAAIRTYLGLGFVPDCTGPGQTARWRAILARLGPRWGALLDRLPDA